jgi:hypothetical protein
VCLEPLEASRSGGFVASGLAVPDPDPRLRAHLDRDSRSAYPWDGAPLDPVAAAENVASPLASAGPVDPSPTTSAGPPHGRPEATVTVQTRLARIDRAIELGRSEYLSAYFCGATEEAHDYAAHVDVLLLLRFKIQCAAQATSSE